MNFELIIYLILGGSFGVLCRLSIIKIVSNNFACGIDNTLIINLISSFLAGIYIALNISSFKFILIFSIGFLGCFSTFSSFIFHLFTLIQEQKYLKFFRYYTKTLIYSFLLVLMGYFITKKILNWKYINYFLFYLFPIALCFWDFILIIFF